MTTSNIKLSSLIVPHFYDFHRHVKNHNYTEYVLPGGRGSCKSTDIAIEIPLIIKRNPSMHCLVLRKVGNTLKDSVYNQIIWAIEQLGLTSEFRILKSPLEIIYKPTGQTIYFRGLDDPLKAKSIKPPFGYIGIAWFEELDQFLGENEIRNVEQSVKRGGDKYYIFKSFNPPISVSNWANKYAMQEKPGKIVIRSDYRTVPREWLGEEFFNDAEHLKEHNERAYRHEYLGEAIGTGGNVFENVTIKTITNDDIRSFDFIYNGVDWGWYPDPWAFNRSCLKNNRLFIFDEDRRIKTRNKATADILINEHGIKPNDLIICDSSENKSVGDYRAFGLSARGAEKGPDSVDYSIKWLQGLDEIIIDNSRCPYTADEFLNYEYARDKQGVIIPGYVDKNNHHIDAVRYSLEPVWKRRGK